MPPPLGSTTPGIGVRAIPAAWRWTLAVALLGLCCAVNVALFTWSAAIPLPTSDAWYFLSAFVAKALDGGVGLTDLFVQRGGGNDHAQPLQKLVLLGHLHAAGLDFRIEAMVGVAAAVLTCGLLVIDLLRTSVQSPARERAALGAMAVLLVGLSLNATGLYTWSLVTLGWMMVLVAVLYWRGLAGTPEDMNHGFLLGVGASLAMGLVLDELAIPVAVALLLARALSDPKHARRAQQIALAVGVVAGLIAARLIIHRLSPVANVAGLPLSHVLAAVDGWKEFLLLVGGPLSNALVHASHAPEGGAWTLWVGLGLVSALAHVAFWWRVLVSRRLPSQQIRVVAIAMMLMSYATVAGILFSRVPDFGVGYIHQPRYVLFYQLGVLAWILLFAAPSQSPADQPIERRRPFRVAAYAAVALLVMLQGWLSLRAWAFLPYQQAYVANAAGVLAALAEANQVPAQGCPDILTICQSPPAERARVLALMQANRLNLFSADFRERHGLVLLAAPSVSCTEALLDWSPRVIKRGHSFNVQADGRSAYWISIERGAKIIEIRMDGTRIKFDAGEGVVSFLHGPEMEARLVDRRGIDLQLVCADGTEARVNIPVQLP